MLIHPSEVCGIINCPPSKSYTHRSLILGALSNGTSKLSNILISDDTKITLHVLKQLGIKINLKNNNAEIKGVNGLINPPKNETLLDMKDSGTSSRLLLSVAALSDKPVVITGSNRLKERPMSELLDTLSLLGAKITYMEEKGFLPICIQGPILNGGIVTISGNISSQFITSLLLVGPFMKNKLILKVKDHLISKPYVDITIDCMKTFGILVKNDNYTKFTVGNNTKYKAKRYAIEGDLSSASYFIAAGILSGKNLTISGLNINSVQADKDIIKIVKKMGGKIKVKNSKVVVSKSNLSGITIDMNNCPDIVQTVSVLAAYAKGKTTLKNIKHLRYKETDRIASSKNELNKMNISVWTTSDTLRIDGGIPKGAEISTYNDHRMAMAFSIAALKAKGPTLIKDSEVVTKSYPNFYIDLKKIGADIKQV